MSSSAATASRSGRTGSARGPGIRWDRLVRWVLTGGIAILLLMVVKSGVEIGGAMLERSGTGAELSALEAENARLKARRDALQGESGVEIEARRLGMVKPGEVPVVVTGLPGDSR